MAASDRPEPNGELDTDEVYRLALLANEPFKLPRFDLNESYEEQRFNRIVEAKAKLEAEYFELRKRETIALETIANMLENLDVTLRNRT